MVKYRSEWDVLIWRGVNVNTIVFYWSFPREMTGLLMRSFIQELFLGLWNIRYTYTYLEKKFFEYKVAAAIDIFA